ncbi:putative B3 domain-containing protein, partial [Tanacetum coccineum]
VDIGLPNVRRRSKSDASWTSYIVRPLEECRLASYEKRVQAIKSAEKLQSNLQSDYPSFVKSMVRSHVYSCFWLGLPQSFCRAHLPKSTVNMVLEDEDGNETEAVFISSRTGLSGGWRAFALEHKIDDGDALVFELIEQRRFKIYIVKGLDIGIQDDDGDMSNVEEGAETKKASMARKKRKTAQDIPAENEKTPPAKNNSQAEKTKQSKEKTSTAKSNSQDKNTKKSKIIVTGTRRSTRLQN